MVDRRQKGLVGCLLSQGLHQGLGLEEKAIFFLGKEMQLMQLNRG